MTSRVLRAPRGSAMTCKGWVQEAALRMLHNNLDPEVAEAPDRLVVYGGTGKAARDWQSFDQIVASLRSLENNETLLVQSGKPVGIFTTHADAPRVLIANSNLVGKWSNWEYFNELERKGLMMYGQMTAGSWIYIGTQGILQGTYETFAECGRRHFKGDLRGKLVLTAGLGGMGGAQPLAAAIAGAVSLNIEVDAARIEKRLQTRYLDEVADGIESAMRRVEECRKQKLNRSIGLLGNAAELLPELYRRGLRPEIVTDQTSAHDELNGYVPSGMTLEEAKTLRVGNPSKYIQASIATMTKHVEAMLQFKAAGSIVFDYGNNIRAQAVKGGCQRAFDIPGFVPEYIRPQFCEGRGPFRWVALSGEPSDIATIDSELLKAFPKDEGLKIWMDAARERVAFQGLPARICWFGYGDREKAGLLINDLVAAGKLKAPIVIGRDHLDCGSVASPNRETEAMKDGSDAVADWPILNAMINAVNGASWVSVHNGGGVGIGYSLHAGMVIVADGTRDAARRLSRVLTSDPGMGVIRHVDAGYERAVDVAKRSGVKVPGLA